MEHASFLFPNYGFIESLYAFFYMHEFVHVFAGAYSHMVNVERDVCMPKHRSE